MMIIISFPFLPCILLSGSEQAEWDPGCCQGYWHKDGGRAGGLHGWDWHSGLLQPPSHCQTAGRLLLWRQTLGKEADWEINIFSCGFYWSAAKETRRQWTANTHRHKKKSLQTVMIAQRRCKNCFTESGQERCHWIWSCPLLPIKRYQCKQRVEAQPFFFCHTVRRSHSACSKRAQNNSALAGGVMWPSFVDRPHLWEDNGVVAVAGESARE